MLFGKKAAEKPDIPPKTPPPQNGAAAASKASTEITGPVEERAAATFKRTLELSREDFRLMGQKQRARRAAAIGSCVSVLARAQGYRDMRLKDLEWFLMPPISAGQYLVAETKPSAHARGGVAGLLLWARVSPEVAQRLADNKDKPPRLKPEDWSSGHLVKVIEAVGNKEVIELLLREFDRRTAPLRPKDTRSA